jgi:hypothetical protein
MLTTTALAEKNNTSFNLGQGALLGKSTLALPELLRKLRTQSKDKLCEKKGSKGKWHYSASSASTQA